MKTLREEIADAIKDGLGEAFVKFEEHDDATDIHTTISDEPITVWRDAIEAPGYPEGVLTGISLDVRAILAEDSVRAEREGLSGEVAALGGDYRVVGGERTDDSDDDIELATKGTLTIEYRIGPLGIVIGLAIIGLLIAILLKAA